MTENRMGTRLPWPWLDAQDDAITSSMDVLPSLRAGWENVDVRASR